MNTNYETLLTVLRTNFDAYEVREDFKVKLWDTTGEKPQFKGYEPKKVIVLHLKENAKFPGYSVRVTYNKGLDSEITKSIANYHKKISLAETNYEFAQKAAFVYPYDEKYAAILAKVFPVKKAVVSEDIPF